MMGSTRKPHRGFTLIELLLVVSMIVLLISLLLPSLHGSKCNAEKLQCLSNMKAMGSGMMQHIVDNQRMLPGPSWYGQTAAYNTNSKDLARWLAPYMGYPKATSTTNVNNNFICPSFGYVAPAGVQPKNAVIYGALSEPNHATGKRVFGYPDFNDNPEYSPSSINAVRSPGTAKAVKDIDQYNNATAGWVAQTARAPIHCYDGGAEAFRNYLYFDTHAETIREFLNGTSSGF